MMIYQLYVIDENWYQDLVTLGRFTDAAYGVTLLSEVLNQNYGYHGDRALIKDLEKALFEIKKIEQRGDPSDTETKLLFELLERAWTTFDTRVDSKVREVSLINKARLEELVDYFEFQAIQVRGFVQRVPSLPQMTLDKLRETQFKFTLPLANVRTILVGGELFNPKATQLRIEELINETEARRADLEAFIETLD